MEKLLLLRSKITRWFTSENYNNWKTLFLVFSVLLTAIVTLYFERNSTIFWFTLITSIIICWSISPLGSSSIEIDSGRVCLAWGLLNYSLFTAVASSLISEQEWGTSIVLGFFVACVLSFILVRLCPYISYLIKLNTTKEDNSPFYDKKTRFNRCNVYIAVSALFFMLLIAEEGKDIKKYKEQQVIEQQNINFSKEEWYTVREWHTEILNGNTIYVIKTAKGRIGVYPSNYPKIRDVNNKTKIKYLAGQKKDGLTFPIKLEIKN